MNPRGLVWETRKVANMLLPQTISNALRNATSSLPLIAAAASAWLNGPANADNMPSDCIGTSAQVAVQVVTNGQIFQGQTVHFRIFVSNPAPGCNFEGGQIGLTYPNDQFVAFAGYTDTNEVPMVWQGGPPVVLESSIPYVISNADVINGVALRVMWDYGPTPNHPQQTPALVHSQNPQTFGMASYITIPICPADVTGDAMINIDDLLGVLSAYGSTGLIRPDITGNQIVNIDDLLAVLSGWGQCH